MVDTRSPLLGLLLQETGGNNNNWGELLNDEVFTLLENAVAGIASISVTGAGTTLSDSQRRAAILEFTGTLGSNEVVTVANVSKLWLVRNNTVGSFSLSMKTQAGSPVAIPQGVWTAVWCDGNDNIRVGLGSKVMFDALQAATQEDIRTILDVPKSEYSVPVGTIQDFARLSVPVGWLQCNGQEVSRTTYANLWAALSVQDTASRTNGSPVLTVSDTSLMQIGFYVGGTGIPAGAKIASVDSATQITLDVNAASTGTSAIDVAPWGVGDGATTFNVPDLRDRFRRTRRGNSLILGMLQDDEIKQHAHTGNTGSAGSHVHTGNTGQAGNHRHQMFGGPTNTINEVGPNGTAAVSFDPDSRFAYSIRQFNGDASLGRTSVDGAHTHPFTTDSAGSHTHPFTTNQTGGSETRPKSAVVMTCIKY